MFEVDIFPVLATDVGDVLVMECLAETVGVVAIVGREGICQRIGLGLEHNALTVVVAKHLVDC